MASRMFVSRALLFGWLLGCTPQPYHATKSDPANVDAATAPDPQAPEASRLTTWTCAGSPCPWGATLRNHALVWPAASGAASTRLGYTVSAGVYLPAVRANGAAITIETGTAIAHAGLPGDVSHRVVATLSAGQTYHVTGLADGEVLSVQAETPFTYRATMPATVAAAPDAPPAAPNRPRGPVLHAQPARWRCKNTPGCFSDPWTGAVIAWPSWAAHQSNGRSGNVLRFVFTPRGEELYPYMGPWAEGCEVTAVSGTPKIIEWRRGSESWRETVLQPGQSHVIHLVPPEDGALIESSDDKSTFSVTLRNCTPQRMQP